MAALDVVVVPSADQTAPVIAGDIGFARTTGLMGRLIRLGEALKLHKSAFNHMFVIDRVVLGDAYVIQATLRGVTDSALLSSVAPGGTFTIITPPSSVDREKLLEFCRAQVGTRYSFLTILSIAFDVVTWDWVPSFMNSYRQSWICSGLVSEGLRYAGWLHEWVNIYTVMPQGAYDALTDAQLP